MTRREASPDEEYHRARMDTAQGMARRATDSLVKLIHFDLAGRYAVALGGIVKDASQAPQDSRTISSVGSRLEP